MPRRDPKQLRQVYSELRAGYPGCVPRSRFLDMWIADFTTRVHELRHAYGVKIACYCEGLNHNGSKLTSYRLEGDTRKAAGAFGFADVMPPLDPLPSAKKPAQGQHAPVTHRSRSMHAHGTTESGSLFSAAELERTAKWVDIG